jgi:carboxyl-terminal processing protease
MVEVIKGLAKIFVMALLTVIVTSTAFFAGYSMHWATAPVSAALAPPPATMNAPTVVTTAYTEPPEFALFWEAWGIIQREFYGKVSDAKEMTYGAIRGAVATLGDENTAFLDPVHARIFSEDISGSFEGIGAAVRIDESGRLIIAEPFNGQPAAKAGLKRGDIITKVDGTIIQGMSLIEAISLIRGPAGTTVVLTIVREGIPQPFEVSIVRKKIEIPTVTWRMLPQGIAYIQLAEFSGQATANLQQALTEVGKEHPKGLILDLRDNPGGFLQTAVEVASEFLKDGTVLVEQQKGGERHSYPVIQGGLAPEVPLVVLVNRGSASAAEIAAGAIQDNGRGILLGEQTFGKGSVQVPHDLSDGSELRVTIAHWLTPNGHDIDQHGLVPDIVVEQTAEDQEAGRDPQLDRAVEYLLTGKK